MSIAIPVRIPNSTIQDIVLLSPDDSLADLLQSLYQQLRPAIPDVWFEDSSDPGTFLQAYVEWTSECQTFPQETPLTEGNVAAVLTLLEKRSGVREDVLCVSLTSS